MTARTFQLPAELEIKLFQVLQTQGVTRETAGGLASNVQKLSDYFTTEDGGKTPWTFGTAYLIYYFPLNVLRMQAVLAESFRKFPWTSVEEIIDFGSGPGTVHAALELSTLSPKPILAVESDSTAIEFHRRFNWTRMSCHWADRLPPKIKPGTLGIFCYSLLESPAVQARLSEFDHVLIVSPSTRSQGRRLLEIRAELSTQGFSGWAPCTHQMACPLLTQSKSDWCHDRIAFQAPDWFRRLESHLPMKNETVTFSYWFASRTEISESHPHRARVIGDTLYEKGKVRQLVCRGPEREFLAWLTRDGEAPRIPRGSLIDLPTQIVKKSNELRGYQ